VLHITNGDSTVASLGRARIGGDVVAWRDVLHEGPVPPLAPAELRPVLALGRGAGRPRRAVTR
jgi:hypothetical protein